MYDYAKRKDDILEISRICGISIPEADTLYCLAEYDSSIVIRYFIANQSYENVKQMLIEDKFAKWAIVMDKFNINPININPIEITPESVEDV